MEETGITQMRKLLITVLMFLLGVSALRAERIKDIVDIQGERGNPLTGIGLVVGLSDTGDTSLPSRQMLTNILSAPCGMTLRRVSYATRMPDMRAQFNVPGNINSTYPP